MRDPNYFIHVHIPRTGGTYTINTLGGFAVATSSLWFRCPRLKGQEAFDRANGLIKDFSTLDGKEGQLGVTISSHISVKNAMNLEFPKEPKWITCLRHPLPRAYSGYLRHRRAQALKNHDKAMEMDFVEWNTELNRDNHLMKQLGPEALGRFDLIGTFEHLLEFITDWGDMILPNGSHAQLTFPSFRLKEERFQTEKVAAKMKPANLAEWNKRNAEDLKLYQALLDERGN